MTKETKEKQPVKSTKEPTRVRLGFSIFGILLAVVLYFYPFTTTTSTSKFSPMFIYLFNLKYIDVCQKYALMMDAGSTGSRIHVYRFHQCRDDEPVKLEEEELFAQTIPGLSAYPDDPQKAAESLDVLLDDAVRLVPVHLQHKTPIAVKATAGLRLLGQEKSDLILKTVRTHIETKYPFPIVGGDDGVAIMDGRDEGVFAWITVNFLLGNLDKGVRKPTAAILDLGGGSTQIVFEPETEKIEEGDHKYVLNHNGEQYVLYQHSYLGYGLMEARKRMHQQIIQSGLSSSHACLPRDLNWEYTKLQDSVSFIGQGSFDDCTSVADLVFNKDKACASAPCAFDGIYQPMISQTFTKGPIYVFSYFYDRTQPLGLPASFYMPELGTLTESICSGEFLENVTDINLRDELLDRPEWCLDLSFIYRLLSYGYEIPNDREITIAKKIDGVETGWCLGAAIAILGELKNID